MIYLHLHHGGRYTHDPSIPYNNGVCEVFKRVDVDQISTLEVGKMVKSLGTWITSLWYRYIKSGYIGLLPLNTDMDVSLQTI